jgi:hypothetical protein
MKIPSEYLQNQIPENAKPVRQTQETEKHAFKQVLDSRSKERPQQPKGDELRPEFSQASNRILSTAEKDIILQLFSESELMRNKTYDSLGKESKVDIAIGKSIDIQG